MMQAVNRRYADADQSLGLHFLISIGTQFLDTSTGSKMYLLKC